MVSWEGFLYGLAGGALAEALKWFQMRHDLHRGLPDWSRSSSYWIVTLVMAVAGGVLVFVYLKSGLTLEPILAVNVGMTAPLILASLSKQLQPVEPGKID